MIFTQNGPLPLHIYGPNSPILACEGVEMEVGQFDLRVLDVLKGVVPQGCNDFLIRLDRYLDIPLFNQIVHNTWESQGDVNLWFYKLRGFETFKYSADWAAEHGHLEVLKWVRNNGGPWTADAADMASLNGNLDVLKWIRNNGGEWTHWAADGAAEHGHLETLKWIRNNGGNWTSDAADWAAKDGHLETLQMDPKQRRRLDFVCGGCCCREWALGDAQVDQKQRWRLDFGCGG